MIVNSLVFAQACIVAIICILLVLHSEYEDGLIGRIALTLIIVASLGRALKIVDGDFETIVSPVATLIWTGFSLFFIRHYFRFYIWYKFGKHSWKEANSILTMGKKK